MFKKTIKLKIYQPYFPALLIIVLAGIAAYWNSLASPFHFDDKTMILENAYLRDWKNITTLFQFNPLRFITFTSFLINIHFSNFSSFAFHLTNLSIHVFNGILVFFIFSLIFSLKKQNCPLALSLCPSLLFMLHPIQTQAVTYIWQRAASLTAFFYLFSLLFYLKGRLLNSKFNSYLMGSWFFGFCSLFCKQNSFSLFFVLMTAEFCFFAKPKKWREAGKRLFPFLLFPIVIIFFTLLWSSPETHDIEISKFKNISSYSYFLTQMLVIKTYLRLIFIPFNQNLDYLFQIQNSLSLHIIFSFSFLTLLVFFFFRLSRISAFGILFFILALSVESSFLPLSDVIWEHRLYLPLVGLLISFTDLVQHYMKPKLNKPIFLTVFTLILCVCFVATLKRNSVWNTEIDLWRDTTQKSFGKLRPHYNLGNALLRKGQPTEAIRNYRIALKRNPNSALVLGQLGTAYTQIKWFPKAIRVLERAVSLTQEMALKAQLQNNLGVAFEDSKQISRATKAYQKAVSFDPSTAVYLLNLAQSYSTNRQYQRSIETYQKALGMNVNPQLVYFYMAFCYERLGKNNLAKEKYFLYLKLFPTDAETHYRLAHIFFQTKNFSNSVRYLRKAKMLGHPVSPEHIQKAEELAQIP